MTHTASKARDLILNVALDLIYDRGATAISIDDIVDRAGVSRKTFYYHFRSKDDLITAYMEERGAGALTRFDQWAMEAEAPDAASVARAILSGLKRFTQATPWRGCGFARIAVELAHLPGHPAHAIAAGAKRSLEARFEALLTDDGRPDAAALARRILLVIDGAMMAYTIRRDPILFDDAIAVVAAILPAARPETAAGSRVAA